MILLQIRDTGPCVVALQILLNRHWRATRVLVDGIFGPLTESAVKEFQRQKGLEPVGIFDWRAWEQLAARDGYNIISANDIYDPLHQAYAPPELQRSGYIATGGMSGGVLQIINDIRQSASRQGSIVLLRFHGHGRPGLMGVSGGSGSMRDSQGEPIYRDVSGQELPRSQRPTNRWGQLVMGDHERDQTTISNETFQAIEQQLRTLRSYFTSFGSIELHGCKVGRGPAGRRLLTSIASTLNLPASAGIGQQTFGLRTALRFEGRVETVYPSGRSLRSWARQAAQSTPAAN